MSVAVNDKIEKACVEARETLAKLGIEENIQSELDWVLGSYRNDHNPVGLYEVGEKAYRALENYKQQKPKAVTKKTLDELQKALKTRSN